MTPLSWQRLLTGLRPKHVRDNIYEVHIKVLGDHHVGPYDELLDFVKETDSYILAVQVHHIVNGEHLNGTGWEYKTAPCVALGKVIHEQYHGRFSSVLPVYHGRLDSGTISKELVLELYHDMFKQQTGWEELWRIAARILTGRVRVPADSRVVSQ